MTEAVCATTENEGITENKKTLVLKNVTIEQGTREEANPEKAQKCGIIANRNDMEEIRIPGNL